eukprot:gene6210-7937_t
MHKRVYAEDMLTLNAATADVPVAANAGHPEVGRLELSREVIFESVRVGFAAAYDLLVNHNPALRGSGAIVAKELWPDSKLLEIPEHILRKETQLDLYGDAGLSPTAPSSIRTYAVKETIRTK